MEISNKFKRFVAIGLAAITIATGANMFVGHNDTQNIEVPEAIVQVQEVFAVHNSIPNPNLISAEKMGTVEQVNLNGENIGQIKYSENGITISSNLTRADLGRVYQQLEKENKLGGLELSEIAKTNVEQLQKSGASQEEILAEIGSGIRVNVKHFKYQEMSDIEKVVSNASIGYRKQISEVQNRVLIMRDTALNQKVHNGYTPG